MAHGLWPTAHMKCQSIFLLGAMPKAAEGENDMALNAALDVNTLFGVKGKTVLITGGAPFCQFSEF